MPVFDSLSEIYLTLHDGLDGSGGHSIFNQAGSTQTHNIIMHMFQIENIKNSLSEVLWEYPSHVSSNSCRPVVLLMGKETRKNCEIVASIKKERKNAKFSVDYQGKSLNVIVDARCPWLMANYIVWLLVGWCILLSLYPQQKDVQKHRTDYIWVQD